MFFVVKKRMIALVLASVIGVCGLIVLKKVEPAQSHVLGRTIVVDAGHGGIDGGVVGENTKIKESEINLAIAKCLREFLMDAGYKVVLTRKGADSLKRGKLEDMKARKEVILGANAHLVVSIHQNEYPRSYVKGPQVFYAPSGEDQEIAATMQKALNDRLSGNRKEAKGDYYILQCSSVPSLLVECGFLSNPEEESMLVTGNYQQKVAYAIFCGINHILDIDSLFRGEVII